MLTGQYTFHETTPSVKLFFNPSAKIHTRIAVIP